MEAKNPTTGLLVPSPPKRRLVTVTESENGKQKVGVTISTTSTLNQENDLEHVELTDKEKSELELLQKNKAVIEQSENREKSVMKSTTATETEEGGRDPYEDGILMADRLEAAYHLHRDEVLRGDPLSTPTAVLHKMAKKFGTGIHFEYHSTRINGQRRYLVEVIVGKRKGFGEAARKHLAVQMACANLLWNLELTGKFEIPHYYLIPGCRVSPRILIELEILCEILKIQEPQYIIQPRDPENQDGPLYTVKCQIGEFITIGESDQILIARRLAAKQAFEGLTGVEVPINFVCCGPTCLMLAQNKIKPRRSQKLITLTTQTGDSDGSGSDTPAAKPTTEQKNTTSTTLDDYMADYDEDDWEEYELGEDEEVTRERMNLVVQSMTNEVKERLVGLRISSPAIGVSTNDTATATTSAQSKQTENVATAAGQRVGLLPASVKEEGKDDEDDEEPPLPIDSDLEDDWEEFEEGAEPVKPASGNAILPSGVNNRGRDDDSWGSDWEEFEEGAEPFKPASENEILPPVVNNRACNYDSDSSDW